MWKYPEQCPTELKHVENGEGRVYFLECGFLGLVRSNGTIVPSMQNRGTNVWKEIRIARARGRARTRQ